MNRKALLFLIIFSFLLSPVLLSQNNSARKYVQGRDNILVNKSQQSVSTNSVLVDADTISYIDVPGVIFTTTQGGFVSGTNGFGDLGKYQRFDFNRSYNLVGLIYYFGAKEVVGTADNVSFVVREVNDDGTPGAIHFSTDVTTDDLDTLAATSVTLPSPLLVDVTMGSVFIGYEWTASVDDQFTLVNDDDGFGDGQSRSWEQWNDGTFFAYSDGSSWGLDLDLWIAAVVEPLFENYDVTFNVDMGAQVFKGFFNPATDIITVRGSFQANAGDPGGDWQGEFFAMTDPDADTIYSVTATLPDSFAGKFYEYKFAIAPAGWEGVANKNFTLTGPSMNLPTFWFNNDSSYFIATPVTNTIEFTADIGGILGIGAGGAFDVAQDSLTVAGLDWDQLGKDVVGNRTLAQDQFTPAIFRTTLTFTSGSATIGEGDSTKWKFKAEPGSRFSGDGWESGADRWHVYTADGLTTVLPTIVPRITPLFGPLVNDVEVTFNVDLTGATNRYNGELIDLNTLEFVGMRGGADFLGTWVTGGSWTPSDTVGGVNMKVLQNAGGNLWTRTTMVPAGTNAGFYEYKYAAMYPGADTINGGSSPLDNEGGFGENHNFTLIDGPAIVLNNQFGVFGPTSVERVNDIIPAAYQLEQNYPNPFNPSTKIRYNIPEAGLVTLKVYNLLGQEVATLVNNEQVGGIYEVNFDAAALSSGIYFYTLDAKNFTSTKKMILIK
jgi:hypothetical protein